MALGLLKVLLELLGAARLELGERQHPLLLLLLFAHHFLNKSRGEHLLSNPSFPHPHPNPLSRFSSLRTHSFDGGVKIGLGALEAHIAAAARPVLCQEE